MGLAYLSQKPDIDHDLQIDKYLQYTLVEVVSFYNSQGHANAANKYVSYLCIVSAVPNANHCLPQL